MSDDFTYDDSFQEPVIEVPDKEEARERRKARAYMQPLEEFQGTRLHAFSVGRQVVYHDLRNMLQLPPISQCVGDNDEFLPEAARILFICLHSAEELQHFRLDLKTFQQRIDRWMESNIPAADSYIAQIIAMRIWNASFEGLGESDDADEMGKPLADESRSRPRWWRVMLRSLPARLRGQKSSSSGSSHSSEPTITSSPIG